MTGTTFLFTSISLVSSALMAIPVFTSVSAAEFLVRLFHLHDRSPLHPDSSLRLRLKVQGLIKRGKLPERNILTLIHVETKAEHYVKISLSLVTWVIWFVLVIVILLRALDEFLLVGTAWSVSFLSLAHSLVSDRNICEKDVCRYTESHLWLLPRNRFHDQAFTRASSVAKFLFHLISPSLTDPRLCRYTVSAQRKAKRLAVSHPHVPPPTPREISSSPNRPNSSIDRPPYLPSLNFSRRDSFISHHSGTPQSTHQSVHLANDSSDFTDDSDIERTPVLSRRTASRSSSRITPRSIADQTSARSRVEE